MTSDDWLGEFITEVEEFHGRDAAAAAAAAFTGFESFSLKIKRQSPVPSKGLAVGVIEPRISSWNATLLVGSGRGGTIGWELLRLRKHNPFRIPAKEDELRAMLEAIAGYIPRPDYPTVRWQGLVDGGLQPFLEAVQWTAERIRKSNPAG